MNDLERNLSKEIKLQKILFRLHNTVKDIEKLFELQHELFSRFVRCAQSDLKHVSKIWGFCYDEHVKDYREFTIKRVHDEAKRLRRKENGV